MKTYDKYINLVKDLTSKGISFDLDAFNRNSGQNYETDWNELAKVYGYKRPKTAYFSKGGCFYMLLQRVYRKAKENGSI